MIRFFSALLFLLLPVHAEVVAVSHPAEKLPVGKTVVWSPLFQATWDTMNKSLGGKPSKVEPPNELMARLDDFAWDAGKVMPEAGWKVWGGVATKDFLETVNREAAAITGEAQVPFKLMSEIPGGLACFGLLDREVGFKTPFFRSRKVPLKFGAEKAEVSYFRGNRRLERGFRGKCQGAGFQAGGRIPCVGGFLQGRRRQGGFLSAARSAGFRDRLQVAAAVEERLRVQRGVAGKLGGTGAA